MKNKILIVDDEPDINLTLKMTLEEHGFEMYREIKKIDRKLRVCFLTAGEMYYGTYGDIFDQNQFIRKPIENQELVNRITEIIK